MTPDETHWMSVAIEILAVGAAVAFALVRGL
jgi:hypothetical protein